jgi:hypothetical protein
MPLGGEKTKDFEKRVKDKKECSWEWNETWNDRVVDLFKGGLF